LAFELPSESGPRVRNNVAERKKKIRLSPKGGNGKKKKKKKEKRGKAPPVPKKRRNPAKKKEAKTYKSGERNVGDGRGWAKTNKGMWDWQKTKVRGV